MKYRKKPVVIDALQLQEKTSLPQINSFFGITSDDYDKPFTIEEDKIIIKTLEGNMTANLGDFIIKGIKGEFYPCKADIFEATYEKFEDHKCEELIPIENQNSDIAKKEIFAVMIEGRQTPSKIYNEEVDAENEAKRLALKERLKTYTLKAISSFSLNDVIKTKL